MNGLKQVVSEVFLRNKKYTVFFKVFMDYIKWADCFDRSEFTFQHLHKWACLPSSRRCVSYLDTPVGSYYRQRTS